MKAAIFKALRAPLVIEDRPDPTPAPTEVLIKIGRCGICGSDLHAADDPAFHVPQGAVLGHEYAGEIIDLGRDVEGLCKGDRVAVMPLHGCGKCANCLAGDPAWCSKFRLDGGGYAQFSVAEPQQCVRLPKTVSFEDGALVEPLSVALHAVNLAGIQSGSRVLVLGAGPIGLGVIFWARHLGASKVAVADLTRQLEETARVMGADFFLTKTDDLDDRIVSALGGRPDVVFECVGKPGLIVQSIGHVRPRGKVVLVGLCTVPEAINPFDLVQKEVVIQPSAFFNAREFEMGIDTFEAGHVQPHAMITDTVALTAMSPAFEALKHRTTQCKVLVDPWSN